MAVAAQTSPDEITRVWKTRIQQAKDARKPYERIWLSNLAFAAGQHWLVWDQVAGTMRHLQDVDPRQRDRVLYTADRINEYLQAQLGELTGDDDRPELLTAQDGETAEEVAKELNQAAAHGWNHEWHAQAALARARKFMLTMGVSAVRCRFDPSKGPVTDHQPVDAQGKPVQDPNALNALATQGTLPDGSLPKFQPVHEGRSIMEPFTAFQILSPPGVVHEDDFPWEGLVRPVHVDEVFDRYGVTVTEDGDIASASGLSTGQNAVGTSRSADARLRDHVWLYTCYRKPCRKYPNGQTVVLASNQFVLCDAQEELPYTTADGTPSSGIVYLHWWRLDDRFWSRAFIEPLKDPQRALNESKTIKREILVRGLPKVFVKKGTLVENPTGVPMEKIEVDDTGPGSLPVFHAGIGPGPWWDTDIQEAADDLAHASTLSAVRLGEVPANADTYSALALLNENEQVKRDPITSDHRAQIGKLEEFGVHDIRKWWDDGKLLLVSGDDGKLSQATFKKSQVPDFFIVDTAKGSAAPRSQAAEIKKIDAIWAAAEQSGLATQDPQAWVKWYVDSIEAGEAQDIPEVQKDSQQQLAAFENFLMQHGEPVEPADYDLLPVHIPVHREAQDQARAAGDTQTVQLIEEHVQASITLTQLNAARIAGAQAQPSPLAPAPPAGGAPPVPALVAPDFHRLQAGN